MQKHQQSLTSLNHKTRLPTLHTDTLPTLTPLRRTTLPIKLDPTNRRYLTGLNLRHRTTRRQPNSLHPRQRRRQPGNIKRKRRARRRGRGVVVRVVEQQLARLARSVQGVGGVRRLAVVQGFDVVGAVQG